MQSARILESARFESERRVKTEVEAAVADRDRELTDSRAKLAMASKKESDLLRKEREVDAERQLVIESARIHAEADRFAREEERDDTSAAHASRA